MNYPETTYKNVKGDSFRNFLIFFLKMCLVIPLDFFSENSPTIPPDIFSRLPQEFPQKLLQKFVGVSPGFSLEISKGILSEILPEKNVLRVSSGILLEIIFSFINFPRTFFKNSFRNFFENLLRNPSRNLPLKTI